MREPRIGILVVAYNAATTLARVLDRIPREFVSRISDVLVSDDSSADSTFLVGMGYRQVRGDLPLTVVRQPRNLGYGGNQKVGYRWAIEQDLDIVVLLHGDGQYAPELLPEMVEPLVAGRCDAVMGSRMMEPGAARKGGMPLYKYVGNRILTRLENALAGAELSEWHSGYRAYSVDALRRVDFESNSDGFDFDTQIILQLLDAGLRIEEIPIPTYYGDEVSYVNGLGYARDVTRHAVTYRMGKMGFGAATSRGSYEEKVGEDTSHGRIVDLLSRREPSRILDLGCSDGAIGRRLRELGHTVVGVDRDECPAVRECLDDFVCADLEDGIPAEVGTGFDLVLAADVVEHVRDPGALLDGMRAVLSDRGVIVTSIPNFAHWYPRARVALGRFDYDRRGILDQTHLRFFTRRSFERLVASHGLAVRRRESIGLPLEVVQRGGKGPGTDPAGQGSPDEGLVKRIDRISVGVWPTLFAYQFLYELVPDGSPATPAAAPVAPDAVSRPA